MPSPTTDLPLGIRSHSASARGHSVCSVYLTGLWPCVCTDACLPSEEALSMVASRASPSGNLIAGAQTSLGTALPELTWAGD